ncbi:MAG TPA: hypothetical protein VFQ85_03490 [Mycobacteriales bacterium]|nr:hypothetical protein [Mycobacteriales bacterium]
MRRSLALAAVAVAVAAVALPSTSASACDPDQDPNCVSVCRPVDAVWYQLDRILAHPPAQPICG